MNERKDKVLKTAGIIGVILVVAASVANSISTGILVVKFSELVDGNTLRTSQSGGITQSAHRPFDWGVYLDPKRPEFWDDGHGEPPRPFRHVAAYPTSENVENLKRWVALQEEKITEVRTMIGKGEIEKHEKSIQDVKDLIGQKALKKPNDRKKENPNNLSAIELVYVYSKGCSACREARAVVDRLKTEGVDVVRLQVDYEDSMDAESLPYTEEYRLEFPVSVTPTFYIKVSGYPATKIEGFKPYGELMAELVAHLDSRQTKKI